MYDIQELKRTVVIGLLFLGTKMPAGRCQDFEIR